MKEFNKLGEGRDNNQRLYETMNDYGMNRRWVSKQLCVNLSTVDRWLQPQEKEGDPNPTYRAMPDAALRLLKYCINDEDTMPMYCPPEEFDLPPRDDN